MDETPPLDSEEVALEDDDQPETVRRPTTRADCIDGLRPCPFVACRHHLFFDLTDSNKHKTGVLERQTLPNVEGPWQMMTQTCSIDVAKTGGRGYAEVGRLLNLSADRVRMVEASALAKLKGRIHERLANSRRK